MQDDVQDTVDDTEVAPAVAPGAVPGQARRDAQRERARKAQLVQAQVARARSGGAAPNADEAARLVAEFKAKGGQVTVVPEAPPEPEKDVKGRR